MPSRRYQPPPTRQRRNFRFQRKGRELPSITSYFHRTVRGAEYLTQGALAERVARMQDWSRREWRPGVPSFRCDAPIQNGGGPSFRNRRNVRILCRKLSTRI